MSFKPARPTRAPVKAEPAIKLGIARAGSAAPNGMAPSVMKERPMIMFVKPESRSSSVNLSLNKTVATNTANGGTIPAAITAAITTEPPEVNVAARVPVPKTYAALLTGPPISTAIIPPTRRPRRTAELPDKLVRKLFRPVLIAAIGIFTASIANPVNATPIRGINKIDFAPSSERGTFTYFLTNKTIPPAKKPPTRAPRKPDDT